MASPIVRRELRRNDRHVSRARLRMGAGVARRRLASLAEEALRLCSLPGEEFGRVYHFRRVHIAGPPANGDRSVWLEAFQCELTRLARCAVHGADCRAASAEAVFFHSQAEACEALLTLLARRRPADAWFWPAVSGSPSGAPASDRLVDLIETLRVSPASWRAVAAAVMESPAADDPVPLLNLLPDAAVAQWMRELGGDRAPPPASGVPASTQIAPVLVAPEQGEVSAFWRVAPTVEFPGSTQTVLARAAAVLGRDDNRVLWLASLAVVLAFPPDLEKGLVVSRARASLSGFVPADLKRPPPALNGLLRPVQNHGAPKAAEGVAAPSQTAANSPGTNPVEVGQAPPIDREAIRADPVSERQGLISRPGRCFGGKTHGAGLYFLLNALSRLKTGDDPFEPWFLAHLFQRVAGHAGIAGDDPILLWTYAALEQPRARDIDQRLVRVWAILLRRWCWRNAWISVGEIVRRPGEVTLTSTELDVSLALELADVRIRRVGLDLDPGWVPWFGRVVRFHYLTRAGPHV